MKLILYLSHNLFTVNHLVKVALTKTIETDTISKMILSRKLKFSGKVAKWNKQRRSLS